MFCVHKPSIGNNYNSLAVIWKQSWWLPQLCESDVFILFLLWYVSRISCDLWKLSKNLFLQNRPVGTCCCLTAVLSLSACLTASLPLTYWGFFQSSDKETMLYLCLYPIFTLLFFIFSCLIWMATDWLTTLSISQYSFLICSYLPFPAIILIYMWGYSGTNVFLLGSYKPTRNDHFDLEITISILHNSLY